MSGRHIVLASNTAWSIVNFRAGLIRALVGEGYAVTAVAPPDEYAAQIRQLGCEFVPLKMDNKGTNPAKDLCLFLAFRRLLGELKPGCLLAFTIKPNIYGGLAAHSLDIPVVNNIAGLGTVFINRGWVTGVAMWLYRRALRRSRRVFFQNGDDLRFFVEARLVRESQAALLPGSGVNTEHFAPREAAAREGGGVRFLLIARMLWDKGVGEYVEAAKALRGRHPDSEFALLGFLDVANRTAISREQMHEWDAAGWVRYLGQSDDVRPFIADADCVVLPSYREGTPRTLLEAASMARPVITTDAVGCREVVDEGVNGYLVKVRDALDLAAKMERMLLHSPGERAQMGRRGRQKIEREFDERIVIERYLSELRSIPALSRIAA